MNFFYIFFYLISIITTLPIIATWLMYKMFKIVYKHPLKAFHQSIQWTTVLYIVSVCFLVEILFSIQMIGYIIVFLLLMMIIIIYMQWKKREEVSIAKAFNLLLRISFLMFFTLYCILIIVGIIQRIYY